MTVLIAIFALLFAMDVVAVYLLYQAGEEGWAQFGTALMVITLVLFSLLMWAVYQTARRK